MKLEQKKDFLTSLIDVYCGNKEPEDKSQGICALISELILNKNYLPTVHELFYKACKTWEHFSGWSTFPVPSTVAGLSMSDMYYQTDDMWVGEYGKLRKELLLHYIKYLVNAWQLENEPMVCEFFEWD